MDPDPDRLEFVGAFMADAVEDNVAWVATVYDLEDLLFSVGVTLDTKDKVAWVAMSPYPGDLSLSFGVALTDTEDDGWFTPSEEPVLDTLIVSVDPNSNDTSLNVKFNFNAAYPYYGACVLLILHSSVLLCVCSSLYRYFNAGLSSLMNMLTWTLYLNARYIQYFRSIYCFWYDVLCRPLMLLMFYLSILYWDTIDLFQSPPPLSSRKFRCWSCRYKP